MLFARNEKNGACLMDTQNKMNPTQTSTNATNFVFPGINVVTETQTALATTVNTLYNEF